jgi:hypothetical protein
MSDSNQHTILSQINGYILQTTKKIRFKLTTTNKNSHKNNQTQGYAISKKIL